MKTRERYDRDYGKEIGGVLFAINNQPFKKPFTNPWYPNTIVVLATLDKYYGITQYHHWESWGREED